MQIRKERSHRCGHTNIDFRSMKDNEAIKTYQPWMSKKTFGTMGNSDYKLPVFERKKTMGVTEEINMQRNMLSEIPDPKYHKTALYYASNKIPIKTKAFFTNERVAQLDESFKGKDKFTGDSMMIADITKLRKNKTGMFYDKERLSESKNL